MEVSFYSRSRLLFLSSSVCRKWSSTIVGVTIEREAANVWKGGPAMVAKTRV
jgi:hypothetical protein